MHHLQKTYKSRYKNIPQRRSAESNARVLLFLPEKSYQILSQQTKAFHAQIQMGACGPAPRLKNYKNIGFLSNTGPDLIKKHQATKPAFNVGPVSAR